MTHSDSDIMQMSFRKTSGPSVRDEEQLKKLVKSNTKPNGHVQWAVIEKQFCPKDRDRWGKTTASALKNLHRRRTKRNPHGRRHPQFKQDDEDDDELSKDNHGEEEVFLFSEDDFSNDTIEISPHFDGFDRVLRRNVDNCWDIDQMMLAFMLDDLVKGI